MNNVVIWHLNTLQNDRHDKSSSHLSPYKFITEYIPYAVCYLFYNQKLVPLNPLHLFHPTPLSPPLWQPLIVSVSINLSLFVHLFWGFFWPSPAACGILIPRPVIELMTLAVEVWSLNHWTAREVPVSCSVFQIAHISEITQYLCCSLWLFSLSMSLDPSMLLQMAKFHFLWLSNSPLFIYTTFSYPFIYWWTLRLLSILVIVKMLQWI